MPTASLALTRGTGIAPGAPDLTEHDLVLLGVVGSTAYGLDHAGSDIDRLGVFRAPARQVLGLTGIRQADATHVTFDPKPDSCVHEVAKFCSLALLSNPTAMELLYLTSYEVCTDIGAQLIELRAAFLSGPLVRSAYGGYASQQAYRLISRAGDGGTGTVSAARTAKQGRHCLRLVRQGLELLITGELTLDVTSIRDELFAAGDLAVSDPDQFFDLFTLELAKLDASASDLPEHPERDLVEEFVINARRDQLGLLAR